MISGGRVTGGWSFVGSGSDSGSDSKSERDGCGERRGDGRVITELEGEENRMSSS